MKKKILPKCRVCTKRVWTKQAIYCKDCSHISYRMKNERIPRHLRDQVWAHLRKRGKRCYYTEVKLELYDSSSPWYLNFEHVYPGTNKKMVPCAAVINAMKSDMADKEWRRMVFQVADHWRKGTKVKKIKLVYWYRMYAMRMAILALKKKLKSKLKYS